MTLTWEISGCPGELWSPAANEGARARLRIVPEMPRIVRARPSSVKGASHLLRKRPSAALDTGASADPPGP
jgi:hypothetical protein